MLVSTKGRYALRVMIELAGHDREEFVPLGMIVKKQDISVKYLESIIVVLSKAGLVDGLRGKGGGYRLNRAPGEYSVGQILRLTEGDLATVACLAQDAPECPRAEQCATRWLWEQMDDAVNDVLDRVTLAMLAEVSRQRGNPECVL